MHETPWPWHLEPRNLYWKAGKHKLYGKGRRRSLQAQQQTHQNANEAPIAVHPEADQVLPTPPKDNLATPPDPSNEAPITDHEENTENNLLSNWKEEAWKNQGFNGIWTRDLHDTGAMLYQLSYEATHWERGQFIEFISSGAVKWWEIYMK